MSRKILTSAKGLTLVELLLSLSLVGVVSVLIVGVLVSGINSYKSVNKQISLHDEANAIMTKFSNEIFVATKVEPVYPENYPAGVSSSCTSLIEVTKYDDNIDPTDDKVILGFQNNGGQIDAVINGQPINSPLVTISCDEPDSDTDDPDVPDPELNGLGYSSIVIKDETVLLKLLIEDKNKQSFNIKEEVSFVKVN